MIWRYVLHDLCEGFFGDFSWLYSSCAMGDIIDFNIDSNR